MQNYCFQERKCFIHHDAVRSEERRVDAPTADITTAKLLLNSFISTNGAHFIYIDLSNFYLITPFNKKSDYEYVWIPEWFIPEDITEEYNLRPLIQNGRVLAEFRTCIYGLPQAGHFAYIKLVKHIADDCYFLTGHTSGIFRHPTRPTTFNIVVN